MGHMICPAMTLLPDVTPHGSEVSSSQDWADVNSWISPDARTIRAGDEIPKKSKIAIAVNPSLIRGYGWH